MALSDVDDIVSVLQQNDGEYIMVKIPGEDKFATSPVGDAYGCMCTARMIPVLNGIDGFIRKQFYPNVNVTLASEWGAVNNVRYFISSQGSVSANASLLGNDVANCFVTAKEGYKVVRVRPDHYKLSLIELEVSEGDDNAQAGLKSLQRKRASGKALKKDAVLRPLWRHREVGRNDLLARKSGNRIEMKESQKWQAGGKARFIYLPPGYNNDPVMLRHTAGCSFYQGQAIEKVVAFKSSLIDLETYTYEELAA